MDPRELLTVAHVSAMVNVKARGQIMKFANMYTKKGFVESLMKLARREELLVNFPLTGIKLDRHEVIYLKKIIDECEEKELLCVFFLHVAQPMDTCPSMRSVVSFHAYEGMVLELDAEETKLAYSIDVETQQNIAPPADYRFVSYLSILDVMFDHP